MESQDGVAQSNSRSLVYSIFSEVKTTVMMLKMLDRSLGVIRKKEKKYCSVMDVFLGKPMQSET